MFLFGVGRYRSGVEAVAGAVEAASKRVETVSGRCFCGVLRRYDLSKGCYGAVIRCYDGPHRGFCPARGGQSTVFSYHASLKEVRFRYALGLLRVCSRVCAGSAFGLQSICS